MFLTRLPFIGRHRQQGLRADSNVKRKGKEKEGEVWWERIVRAARFGKPESTAVCFCAAAKG